MTTRRLIEFVTELGAAMSSAGDATTLITRELERIGLAYGLKDLRVSAGPTLLILRYAEEDIAIVDLTTSSPVDLRLDQVSDIYRLWENAEAGRVEPQLGTECMHETLKRKSRFSAPVRVADLGLISGGISLVLAPSFPALFVTLLLGALVDVIKLITGRVPALWLWRPWSRQARWQLPAFYSSMPG